MGKGIRPEVFERAAEILDSGESTLGCCHAIMLAADEIGASTHEHALLLSAAFKPATERIYWFGPIRYEYSSWRSRNWRAANKHRIISLLLLAQMIRFANQ